MSPAGPSPPVTPTKDGASTILTPAAKPVATPTGSVATASGLPSPSQVSLSGPGGKLVIDKDALYTATGRADAFQQAMDQEIPDSGQLWKSGLVQIS